MQMSVQDFSSTGPRWQSVSSIVLGSSLAILLNYIVSPELRTVGIASQERRTSATSATHFVLLGATGDLAVRYIFPALSATQKKNSGVVVYAASRQDSEHVRELLQSRLQKTKLEENSHFWENLRFRRLKTADDFVALCDSIPKNERIIFYLSIPPSGYLDTVRKIAEVCTGSRNKDKLRVVLEKPFGVDEVSAADLFRSLLEVLPEQNIYLVDHYKAKEAVQAIPKFFQRNPSVTALLASGNVQQVQIILNETIGTDSRIDFYDQTGVVRDVVQNHLMEILIEVIEICPDKNGSSRADLISRLSLEHWKIDQHETYHEEVRNWRKNESDVSSTPTFLRASLIATGLSCWQDNVQFILISGKKLEQKVSLARIIFDSLNGRDEREIIFHIGGGSLSWPAVLFRGFGHLQDGIICPLSGTSPFELMYRLHMNGPFEKYHVCQLGVAFQNAYENVVLDVCDIKKEFSAEIQFVLNSWNLWNPCLIS